MPKLKNPVVNNVFQEITDRNGVVVSGNDYGEFHPTAQLRSISDLPKGGVFKGVDFTIPIDRVTAQNYIQLTENMKPAQRIRMDVEIMKDENFASEVFEICSSRA